MDPAPALLHREEMDDQERLDLEEEKREKELSEGGVAEAEVGAEVTAATVDAQNRESWPISSLFLLSRGPVMADNLDLPDSHCSRCR